MMQDFKDYLAGWASATTERQKLQHSYAVLTAVAIIVAGIVSLLNAEAGHKLTFVALIAVIAFLANALVWNLLNSAILSKLPVRPKRK